MSKYEFTADLFSSRIPLWDRVLADVRGRPGLRYLEIGTFEGQSALWIADNVATAEGADVTCLDPWVDYDEMPGVSMDEVRARFLRNVATGGHQERIRVGHGIARVTFATGAAAYYDIAYVDGSHRAAYALRDIVQCWEALLVGGLMCVDDLSWKPPRGWEPWDKPSLAFAAFASCYTGRFEIVDEDAGQIWIRKVRT